jgi:hypothetical protein
MAFLNTVWNVIIVVFSFLWDLLKQWLFVFISPLFKLEMLWIIIPIYINWIFTEIFQEKKGTGMGNAITNGAVTLWVGVDWIRYLIRDISTNNLTFSAILFSKFLLCFLAIIYGALIIFLGLKGNKLIKYLGRVRESTYILIMFSPVIYGIVTLSWGFFLAFLLYAPLFYFIVEMIDKYTPDPKSYSVEEEGKDSSLGSDMSSDLGSDTGMGDSNLGSDMDLGSNLGNENTDSNNDLGDLKL